jgi:hypothetical protein
MQSNSIIEIADFAESLDRVNSEAETAKGTEERIGQFTLWWALRGGGRMHTIRCTGWDAMPEWTSPNIEKSCKE